MARGLPGEHGPALAGNPRKCRISEKEWVKIREIQVAMEADLPDEMALYEESFGED
jgi:hypothetical protein